MSQLFPCTGVCKNYKISSEPGSVTQNLLLLNLRVIVAKQLLTKLRVSRILQYKKEPQSVTKMASPPRPPAGDGVTRITSSERSLHFTGSEASSVSHFDTAATPRDVLVALTYGLELARHGAMLVTEGGWPQLANRTALSILRKKDGISMAKTGLVADRAADTRLLYQLLEQAISSPESGEPQESPLVLERKESSSSLLVRVVPGPGLNCWDSSGHKTALLKLYDQDQGLVVDEAALISLYGLTRSEASFATRIIQGRSIEEAAAELFISAHTARTHLKRIFMKTDTHRQPQLVVRMLMMLL